MEDWIELFFIFNFFFAELHNQFGVFICNFNSHDALEYKSSFQDLMTHQGIIQQTSFLYNPRNGATKRNNWFLTKTTHSY